ncbi:TonB-dependent receptor [Denitratisoma sp. DHT3]|uniref:TonB-dependent receptor n=1 Tax=Denitratisoma sp. DHT3 TaxID=1981880 RepID=UPI001646AD21|nr:TonB-dependent receptor [Denitratisoma sp. DHT3]
MKQQYQKTFAVRTIPALVAAFMAGGACSALAQTGGAALEEIVVTAQKQSERLQDVPISIQAFSSRALENANVTSMLDMRSLAPSVEIKSYPASSEDLQVQMRGIPSQAMNIFIDVATPIHIDGVYIARGSGMNLTVADLESVEILKGPQGTLYGRNAISGAINLKTARPSQDFGFSQNITIGNYGKLVSKTSLNVPLTETLAAKIAYVHDERDGFIRDSNGSGKNWGDRKADAGRFDLRWKPSNTVTVDYGYDWAKTRYISNVNQCLNQLSPIEPVAPVALAYTADPGLCSSQRLSSLPMPHNANITMAPESGVENTGHNLTVEWAMNDTTTFRSITGYRSLRNNYYWGVLPGNTTVMSDAAINFPGNVYLPNGLGGVFGPVSSAGLQMGAKLHQVHDDYLSQEFVLIGRPSPYFKYTTGFYYFDEKGTISESAGQSLIANLAGGGVTVGGVSPMTLISTFNGEAGKAHNSSWAMFGQFTWTPDILSRKLDITPGIRYTRDKREASVYYGGGDIYLSTPYGLPAGALTNFGVTSAMPAGLLWLPGATPARIGAPGAPASGSNTFSKTSPSLTVQYRFTEDMQAYAKVAKGYRSGGFNDQAANGANFAKGYGPETLTSTELGFKGEFLDRKLRTNLAVFQSKYTDQQMTIAGNALRVYDVVNAGKSTYKGFELDVAASITNALRVGLNFSQVKFNYDKIVDQGVDVTQFFHYLPAKNTYSATLDYAFGKIGPGRLNWHLDYAHVDKASTNVSDLYTISGGTATLVSRLDPTNYTTPAYGLWNTRLSMAGIPVGPGSNGDLTVGLWIKNVTDKKYPAYVIDYGKFGTPFGAASTWGEPRTYGVDLTYRF